MKFHLLHPGLWVLAILCGTGAASGVDLPEPGLLHPELVAETADVALFARCPTRKVFPNEDLAAAPGLVRSGKVRMAAARNESEQVSLVLRPKAALTGVAVSFGDLSGPGTIPASAWSWRRVVTVPVAGSTVWYGIGGWETGDVPDPLVPGDPFDAPADVNTTLLLEVRVPVGATAGVYTSAITVTADTGELVRVPMELTVWDIAIPDARSMETVVCGAHLGRPELCRFLTDSGATSFKYGSTAIKLKADKESGAVTSDTTEYDAELEALFTEYGVRGVCVPPSLLGSQTTVNQSYLSTGIPVGDDAFWPVHETYIRQMGDHYRAKGWADRVIYYMMDEIQPNLSDTATRIGRAAKQAYPELDVALTTHEMPDDLAGVLDVWCVPWHFFATRSEDVHRWDELRGRGLRLWSYMNSLYILNADWNPGAMRLFPAVLAKYGYEGALWWQSTYYNGADPWAAGLATMTDKKRGHAFYGSGYLVYPPREGETEWHSSLRWENYSQGLDEYELMRLLHDRWSDVQRTLGGVAADDAAFSADQAMRWWGSLLSQEFRVQTFRKDTTYIQRFRQLIANEIECLLERPLVLVDCESDDACGAASDTCHVRGVCEAGARVEVAGMMSEQFRDTAPSVFVYNVRLKPGANLIPIRVVGADGAEKMLYREVTYQPADKNE
ncbi:MAG: DUF4091 domain-containing protein [bacterium]|nr:DUF4091 domain-containing protein [bacterium]